VHVRACVCACVCNLLFLFLLHFTTRTHHLRSLSSVYLLYLLLLYCATLDRAESLCQYVPRCTLLKWIEYSYHLSHLSRVNNSISDSTCCLCRDGGGCLYTVIQWKTAASVLQSGNWANRPLRRKCTLYRRQQYPFCDVKTRQCIENIHGTFHIASFSPSSSNSSSPGTVAHEHY